MQQVIGYYFKQYFPRYLRVCSKEDFREDLSTEFLAVFVEYFSVESENDYQYLVENQSKLQTLREIHFLNFKLTASKLERIRDVLKNVEKLEIWDTNFIGILHDDVLGYCSNLKKLFVRFADESNEYSNFGTDWTLQKYSKLEFMWSSNKMKGLTNFLELNPNIQTFVTRADYLWANRNMMMAAKFSLNDLGIYVCAQEYTTLFKRLLRKLHMRGVYKRLKLYFYNLTHETILPNHRNWRRIGRL